MPAQFIMKSKLILIMIDGVSSDYFIDYPQFMPHTHSLAKNNTVLTDLSPEKCGSSLPGRTSILTGQSSKNHGIYGNLIWDNESRSFRYATPYDVRTETLFTQAKSMGLDTANLGFGMIKPEDCTLYQPPYWVNDFVSRARDKTPIAVSDDWRKALRLVDDGRLEQAEIKLRGEQNLTEDTIQHPLFNELIEDQRMVQRVNMLIESANSPDLIFTEINATDSVQHAFGYASKTSNFVIAYADMLVGSVIEKLNSTGKDKDYTVIVTSDHGHGNTSGAVFVDNVTTHDKWNAECAILFLENNQDIDLSLNQLSVHDAGLLDDSFLPEDVRGQIIPLANQEKVSFEYAEHGCTDQTGVSKYKSSHSFYPGTQSDKRFAVINGAHSSYQHMENATPDQLFLKMTEVMQLS